MDDADRLARNQLFQEARQLKPSCVKLSQLALKNDASSSGSKELRDAAAELYDVLDRKCRGNPVFDDKLADYVFFPISHVLRLYQKHPTRLAELSTRCVRILLDFGWSMVAIDLGHQLLILFTLFAGGGPSIKISEELQVEAYGALAALFKLLTKTPKGSASLVEVSKIPALGQCLTVVLDGITDGPSEECQNTALLALKSLWLCIKDQEALSTFLPGTISALTKSLMPTIKTPRSRRVLATALDVMKTVLTTVLGDVRTRNFTDGPSASDTDKKGVTLTKSWLKATASQVKLALANVVKLRTHKHEEVRMALERTCLDILDECLNSLPESASLLVETAMSLVSADRDASGFSSQTSLGDLATVHPVIGDLIKDILYKWVTGLPRVMQSNDEVAKQSAMLQLSKAHNLLSGLDVDSGVLDDAIGNSLRDSVLSILEINYPISGSTKASIDDATDALGGLVLTNEQALLKDYRPIIMPHESQIQTRESFGILITSMSTDKQVSTANDLLNFLKGASGNNLISAFWLSFQLLKAASNKNSEFDDFVSSDLTLSEQREAISTELYSYSISVLADSENESDWRAQAVALEIVGYTAQESGDSFRLDLVDTLYPTVQLLGSNNGRLREHAIATLNIMADSCGYTDTSRMIVENVDYLVNAISLKLNTFNISPQAPQVLVMMIRLSGASLLPYLDDVVGSIFAALDNFHGYPRLVDSLFSVLGEIVEESSRSGQLQLANGPDIDHRKIKPTELKVDDIVALLETKYKKVQDRSLPLKEDFPQRPWKDAASLLSEAERRGDQEEQESVEENHDVQKVPPTKVYKMVQNIARLGQHYLTNQSPVLRRRLLELISTACEDLYRNEDEFLPLVNDVWPVLIKRLYDEETFVVIAAMSAISEVLRRAGDFMATRIQSEWLDLMKLARQIRAKAEAEKKGRHGRGIFSQNLQMWESTIQLLLATVGYVRIEDFMFDEILELFGDLLRDREDIRVTLSVVNANAVWLNDYTHGWIVDLKVPRLEGYEFAGINPVYKS